MKLSNVDLAQFDLTSITDVVFHMRYMARNGGEQMAKDARLNLKDKIDAANLENTQILLSLKQHFATEWHRFVHPDNLTDPHQLSFKLNEKHFPYFTKFGNGREIIGGSLLILTKDKNPITYNFDLDITGGTSSSPSPAVASNNQVKALTIGSSNLDDQWRFEITSTHTQEVFEDIDDVILVLDYKLDLPS